MFTSKSLLFVLSAFLATTYAAPSSLNARKADVSATIEVCTDANFGGSCVTIPVVSDQCIDFTGGLAFLNEAISSAVIPDGFVCFFFEEFDCADSGSSSGDEVTLQGGTFPDFEAIQGIFGSPSFNDLASSLSCSPE
ncbi:hypothetical protein M422DRAFT_249604 [Sphaerobolus stellatus SS14]|uniref:Uncharacterized protein n=1 Tax=Sphaerobolus stellatus (strain SS14) TaxID=990650 RepID=A0A0C9VHT7_SPHS4|nr:hypothetical protein M422DRAFT_249604 [Sphaerobolus stellatus SS14]